MMNSIKVDHITKRYDKVEALKGIQLEINRGELFGIIGADGAGKTTLFRILTTLILADGGTATVDGFDTVRDYKAIRKRIGYMPGRFSLYQDMSVEENLKFFASIFDTTIEANYELIKPIYKQIEPFKKRRAGKLSGGMKQKLALCCALIHKPSVLFLDEPTTGVDPVSRKEFWEMLQQLKTQNITIVVSTPYMDEATRCDRIALMREGEFLKIDTPQHIVEQYEGALWAISSSSMSQLLRDLRKMREINSCYAFGNVHHISVKNQDLTLDALRSRLEALSYTSIEITPIVATIEDCFMALEKQKTAI